MKNILMGVSALALATTIAGAGKAEAVQWDLDWGGYYNSAIIYRDSDGLTDDQEGIDVVQDAEIQFTPSIVTDNGLTFGAIVELEAEAGATTNIDDSHVFVSGPFGRIDIGSESGAASKMHYGAPNVGWFGAADGGDVAGYLNLNGVNFGRSPAFAGDANRISYYTPRFSGFQVGASYAHDDSRGKNSPNPKTYGDIFDVGANYVNSFGAFDIAIGGVYSQASGVQISAGLPGELRALGANTTRSFNFGDVLAPTDIIITQATPAVRSGDSDMYGGGMTVAYAGFVLGGNYTEQDIQGEGDDREYFDVGVAYTTGPFGVSFQYAHSELGASDGDYYLGAATYEVSKGVVAGVYAGYGEADDGAGSDTDGFLVGTGFALSF